MRQQETAGIRPEERDRPTDWHRAPGSADDVRRSRLLHALQRAFEQRCGAGRFWDILAEHGQLACRKCRRTRVRVHPEKGLGVTVLCERAECRAVHTVLA